MASFGMVSPRSSPNILNLSVGYIQQISEKLDKYEERALENLDHAISNYVERRNDMKRPILEELEEETIAIQDLNMANLNVVHNKTQCALASLQKTMSEFTDLKEEIRESNNRCVRQFICGDEFNEMGYMLDLCKELVLELEKYRDVEDIVIKVQEYRRKNKNFQRDRDLLADLEEYMCKCDGVFSECSDDDDVEFNRTQASKSTMLLEYLS